MPDPRDKAKDSADVHPPRVDDVAQQRPRGRPDPEGAHGGGQDSGELADEGRPGKGENQAGFLKEKDGEAGRNT